MGGVTGGGLDASGVFRIFGTGKNGTRKGIPINNPSPSQTGLHLLRSEEREAGIGTIVIKRISYILCDEATGQQSRERAAGIGLLISIGSSTRVDGKDKGCFGDDTATT